MATATREPATRPPVGTGRGDSWGRCRALGSALAQPVDRRDDAPPPGFGRLCVLDPQHEPLPVAVREPVEEPPGLDVAVERLREVGWHRQLARLGVELEVDLHLVAGGDADQRAVLRTHPDQELLAVDRHGAAVRLPVDRDADRWPLALPQARNHGRRDPKARRGLAVELDRGVEAHAAEYARWAGRA